MSYEERLPTGLWVEACLRQLDLDCKPYYVLQKGDYSTGLILLKIDGLEDVCSLLTQQRNFMDDTLEWVAAMEQGEVACDKADDFIQRAASRDPDLWVIEIEDRNKSNPFED